MEEDSLAIGGAVDLPLLGHLLGHVLIVVAQVASESLVSTGAGQFLPHLQVLSLPLKVSSVKLQNVLVLFLLGFLKFPLQLLDLPVKP